VPCPSYTPYFTGMSCITCPSLSPIFNGTSGQCTNCPIGTQFSQNLCVSATPNATNPLILSNSNVTGTLPPPSPYDIPCPTAAPLFYNGQCINPQCPAEYPILNISSLGCFACPIGSVWNQYTQSCQSQNQNPNGPNIIGQNQTIGPLVPGTIPCPAAYPFFNGATCFNCYDPTPIFNSSTLQCTACTGGFYSPADYRCYYYNGTNPIYNATIINPQLYPPPNTLFCPQ
jgi:hypothetical protein